MNEVNECTRPFSMCRLLIVLPSCPSPIRVLPFGPGSLYNQRCYGNVVHSNIYYKCDISYHEDMGKNNRQKTVETIIGEEQLGFMPGRGTTDAIFATR